MGPGYNIPRRAERPTVRTVDLQDDAVTQAKVADDAIGAAQILAGAVTHTEAPTLIRVLDRGTALAGGTPPTGAVGGFLFQAGTVVDADGSPFPVVFPTAFPTGLLSVVACFGDSPGLSDFHVGGYSASGFTFYSSAAVTHRINWVAIGW